MVKEVFGITSGRRMCKLGFLGGELLPTRSPQRKTSGEEPGSWIASAPFAEMARRTPIMPRFFALKLGPFGMP
jgi:hypothetical protein